MSSKFKVNLFCNDSLLPSTSDKNVAKNVEWVRDGSGELNLYVNNWIPKVTEDVGKLPKNIWLLESKEVILGTWDWVYVNYPFLGYWTDGNIFTCSKELCAKNDVFKYALSNAAPWVVDRKIYDKTKLVSMISSNKGYLHGHRVRLSLVNKFRDDVDLYGRGFKDIDCKEQGLSDYMFSVAVENGVYDTYFTEKLTDCFACGTIPIYHGCRGVTEYFNEDGIIFLDDDFDLSMLTPDYYYSKMDAIKENFERAMDLPVAEDYLYENYWK